MVLSYYKNGKNYKETTNFNMYDFFIEKKYIVMLQQILQMSVLHFATKKCTWRHWDCNRQIVEDILALIRK